MKDIFRTAISIGDTVAFNPPSYKGLILGTVVAFTPKLVRVSFKRSPSQELSETVIWPSDCVVKQPSTESINSAI
jgi:hypothetical protein